MDDYVLKIFEIIFSFITPVRYVQGGGLCFLWKPYTYPGLEFFKFLDFSIFIILKIKIFKYQKNNTHSSILTSFIFF